jgi:D-proline reductase (dithiol) PrdB
VSLVARHLEANGIPTVIVGCARDIVEHCGAPRFLFSDFPLGNPCGRPFDVAMQQEILGMALELLESARMPRTTVQTPFIWDVDHSWKDRYLRTSAVGESPAAPNRDAADHRGAGERRD